MSKSRLGMFTFEGGYVSSVPRTLLLNILAYGTLNAIITAIGFFRCLKGFDQITAGAPKGSTQLFQTDNNYAGLGTHAVRGQGNVFRVQRVLALVGSGQLRFAGQDIAGVSANSTLQYVKKSGATYIGPALQAGHARPSSQTIYPKNTPGAGKAGMDGSVATVIWRVDSNTGQVSLYSLSSNVLSLSGQSVIQPFPAVDANAQDNWGIGVSKPGFGTAPVFYELPTQLGGEVAESTLAYTRTIAQGSITNGTKALVLNAGTPAGNQFTAADEGRRVSIAGKLDSWIVTVTDGFNAVVNDNATATATNESTVIRHAVDGILRAVEISWTTESLYGQDLAPGDAYPPPSNIKWAGIVTDTMFAEDDDGIIWVGVPGFIGSFPPKSVLFAAEPATAYLDASDGLYWRASKNTVCALSYNEGSTRPLSLQTIWKNTGVLYPQNIAIGVGGRVIAWSGKPVRFGQGELPDVEWAFKVYKDFEGWDAAQTADKPIIAKSDPQNFLDILAFDRKIMAHHVPTGTWCSPVDVTQFLGAGEHLVDAVIVDNKLRFATNTGAAMNLFAWDDGTVGGPPKLTVRTVDVESPLESDTVSQVRVTARLQNTATVTVKAIVDYDDANPVAIDTFAGVAATPKEVILSSRPNIINARRHSMQVEIVSTGADMGVDKIETFGESSAVFIG
jgi:hypothetical protein